MTVLARLALSSVFLCSVSAARAESPADIVKWSASLPKATGPLTPIALTARIQPGWHIYAPSQAPGGPTAMTFRVPEGQSYTFVGAPKSAPPMKRLDENFQMETVFYEGSAKFILTIKKAADTPKNAIPIDVRFQTCNASLCLPPTTVHLTASAQ